MEAASEGDLPRACFSNPRNELYPFGDLIPGGEEFVRWGTLGRLDRLDFNDQRVELDDFLVAVEHVDRKLTRNMRRDGCDGAED